MSADSTEMLARAVRNVDGRLRDLANQEIKLQAWQAPTFLTTWANTGGVYATASYWKDPWGVVHLRGRVTGGAVPSDVFVLPTNYRPQATQTFTVPGGTVDVEADGSVRVLTGAVPFSLDSITFRAYQ